MKIEKIVFSPTGGTQKVANALAKAFSEDGDAVEHDIAAPFADESKTAIGEASLCIITMPCFGGRVPQVAMERLARIKGNGAKCVVAIVYGNRAYDDALLELKDGAEKAGFDVVAAIAAIAEHSIMHQFAAGMPDGKEISQLSEFAERILSKVKDATPNEVFEVPGNRPYKKAVAVPLVPKVTGNCVSCGICAAECPVTAIDSVDFAANKNVCISCMRCIEVCDQNARSVSKTMVKMASMAIRSECMKEKPPELYL